MRITPLQASGCVAILLLLGAGAFAAYRKGDPEEFAGAQGKAPPQGVQETRAAKQKIDKSPSDFPAGKIRVKEKLTYSILWNGIPAGKAVLRVR